MGEEITGGPTQLWSLNKFPIKRIPTLQEADAILVEIFGNKKKARSEADGATKRPWNTAIINQSWALLEQPRNRVAATELGEAMAKLCNLLVGLQTP